MVLIKTVGAGALLLAVTFGFLIPLVCPKKFSEDMKEKFNSNSSKKPREEARVTLTNDPLSVPWFEKDT